MKTIIVYKLGSPANAQRGSSRLAQAGRKAKERALGKLAVTANSESVPPLPVVVTLTRAAPRSLDDDNLAYAFKAVRDGVADGLGVRDNDPRVSWRYAQQKTARGVAPAIVIDIEARE